MENKIKWHPVKEWGNPECSGIYLVTTKTMGVVTTRRYDDYKDKWAFGEPLAWAFLPKPYKAGDSK